MSLPSSLHSSRGFTLVELVLLIILLGILAVTVGSRFSGVSGFSEYAYQQRLMSSLRAMQTRAMFDTRAGYCFQVNFSQSPLAFGPPVLAYASGASASTCSTNIDFGNQQSLATAADELSDNQIAALQATDGGNPIDYIGFDNLGRPLTSQSNCQQGCKIVLRGESVAEVCVESQGYIHACQ